MAGGLPIAAQSPPPLLLVEAWTIELPVELQVTRLAANGEGLVVLQSDPRIYTASKGSGVHLVGSFGVLDIAGLGLAGDTVVLVDRRSGRVVETDLDGRVRGWWALPEQGSWGVASVVLSSCGWVLGYPEGSDRGRLIVVERPGRVVRTLGIPFSPAAMTASGDQIIATETEPPFRVLAVRCGGEDARLVDASFARTGLAGVSWRPLPAFSMGSLVLQTWADMGSDRRRFVLHDLAVGTARFQDFEAPLTLAGAYGSGVVLGLRRIEGLEVVGFGVSAGGEGR
jgi:hypothetical protein